LNPQENIWDEIREKIFKNYALKSMDEATASSRGGSLHPAQSQDRQIHHILPLYRQLTVIWSWFKPNIPPIHLQANRKSKTIHRERIKSRAGGTL
jgi:hypothetical protein